MQWLRDGLGIIGRASETEAMARSLASNDGVYFVPALTGLGAPEWEPRARGTIVGLTRGTTREHLARAALEAMCFGTADVLHAMRESSGAPLDVLRVDGGATENALDDAVPGGRARRAGRAPRRDRDHGDGRRRARGDRGRRVAERGSVHRIAAYTRFAPGEGSRAAQAALGGWHRAVRAAVRWAKDDES